MTKTNKILAISLAVMILLTASLAFFVAAQNGTNSNLDEFDIIWLDDVLDIDFAGSFSEGRAAVSKTFMEYIPHMGEYLPVSRAGFIDEAGNLVAPIRHRWTRAFSEGLAAVSCPETDTLWGEEKWGFIDRYGNTVIPFVFDNANSFSGRLATVVRDGQVGIISNPLLDGSGNPDTITLEINRNLTDNNVAIVSFFDQNTYLDVSFLDVPSEANNVRINLWNGFENMRPLMPAIELYQ